MGQEEASKQLRQRRDARHWARVRRERAEHDRVIAQVEGELRDRIKKASPSRVALMKLKLVRLRKGSAWAKLPRRRESTAVILASWKTSPTT